MSKPWFPDPNFSSMKLLVSGRTFSSRCCCCWALHLEQAGTPGRWNTKGTRWNKLAGTDRPWPTSKDTVGQFPTCLGSLFPCLGLLFLFTLWSCFQFQDASKRCLKIRRYHKIPNSSIFSLFCLGLSMSFWPPWRSLGYLRLPFSITWWLVLLAAYAIQTRRQWSDDHNTDIETSNS